MSLDLNEVKAAQARVYAEVSVYEKGDAALGFLDSGVVDDLVAEIERLRAVSAEHRERDESQDRIREHLTAERDRYRAEWEEAARHALRWQAEYDTAQQEVERLRHVLETHEAQYRRHRDDGYRLSAKHERQRDEARAALARVRALHTDTLPPLSPYCPACNDVAPCPTIRAIDGGAS